MNWLHSLVVVFHLLIATGIVALVLLQRGKGADAGAGFGAGASGTVFGARGSSSFMSRTTATLAVLFIVTSLTLAYLGGRAPEAPKSVIDRVGVQRDAVPALPEGAPAALGIESKESVETPATPAPQPAPGSEPPQQ
jgi:preprotein translocase subunit SecG